MASDLGLFVRQFLRQPHRVVALAPSSTDLARAMASGIGPETGRVAEFGAGTGKLTRAILDRGVAPQDLTLFEMNPDFVSHLRRSFPGVTVHCAGAQTVAEHCRPGLGAVISGLPLLSMPIEVQRAIVGGAFAALRMEAPFVQFTYGPRAPMARSVQADLGLTATRGEMVWNNLPPARVWRFRQGA